MYLGKKIRMERILNRNDGRTIIVPMDHGVTMGLVDGLLDMRETVNDMAKGGADAVLMHKGLVRCSHRNSGRDVGLIIHLSASTALTPNGNTKTLVGTVEEALRHGADGVSVHVNLGDPYERLMVADLGKVACACDDWGVPLVAMVYARGPEVKNGYSRDAVAHCARVGMELGADIVKVAYTGDSDSFADVTSCCCVPVVIAGGPRMDSTRDILEMSTARCRPGALASPSVVMSFSIPSESDWSGLCAPLCMKMPVSMRPLSLWNRPHSLGTKKVCMSDDDMHTFCVGFQETTGAWDREDQGIHAGREDHEAQTLLGHEGRGRAYRHREWVLPDA